MTTLTTVAPGHQLSAAPAASYERCRAAGAPAGVTSSYRTPAAQAILRAAYLANPTTVAYAAPVASSEHVTGYAIDVPVGGPREWFTAHGAAYGWIRTDPRESWHFAYRASRDTHLLDNLTPPRPPTEADDMFSDQDRADVQEALRLLRIVVLTPSGHASPATTSEAVYVDTQNGVAENAAEARRQGGVILGAIAPAPGESRP